MTPTPPSFDDAEYMRRTRALQSEMERRELDAILLTSEADVLYTTGFLTRFWQSPTRPWFVIIPRSSKPIAVIPAIGAELMSRSWISDIRTWVSPDQADDGITLLAEAISEVTSNNSQIGLPMGPETVVRMPLLDLDKLGNMLPGRNLCDATDAVRRVREIKSPQEIEQIRTACHVGGRAFDRIGEIAGVGVTLDTVFRKFQMLLLDEGADAVPYVSGAAQCGGYSDVISPATASPLTQGDVLMLDTGAVVGGYFCDFDRNFAIGVASSEVIRAYDTLYTATEVGIDAARVGQPVCDIFNAMNKCIVDAGYPSPSGRLGHGLGIQLTEWPSLMETDKTPVREGMVLTIEPWLEISQNRIMVHEENIVVRKNGSELLTIRAPEQLPVLSN